MNLKDRRIASALPMLCILMCAGWLAGCHGGGDRPVRASGQVTVLVTWPEPSEGQVATQLIPARSESVLVELFDGSQLVAEELLLRPDEPPWTTEAGFEPVAAGTLMLRGAAYPNTAGSGVAQAAAQMSVIVPPGGQGYPAGGKLGDPVSLVLESTIAEVEVSPALGDVEAGSDLQMRATAKDSGGRTVLVPPKDPFEWSVSPDSMIVSAMSAGAGLSQAEPLPGAASISATGLLTGRSIGAVVVTVREKESQVSGATTIAVTSQVYQVQWRIEPGSNWSAIDRRIAVDNHGTVHVPDRNLRAILRFAGDGKRLADLAGRDDYDKLEAVTMSHPGDAPGAVYIGLSTTSAMVRRLEPTTGDEGPAWGRQGANPGEFVTPEGMVFGPGDDPTLYVADYGNRRVQKFDADGTYRGEITTSAFAAAGGWQPYELAVDGEGNLYVQATEFGSGMAATVEKFDSAGNPLGWWGKDTDGKIGWHEAGSSAIPATGEEPGAFGRARMLAADADGHVYVGDYNLHRITKLKIGPEGGVLAIITDNVEPWQLESPQGIAVSPPDDLYVCGTRDSLLRKFRRVVAP